MAGHTFQATALPSQPMDTDYLGKLLNLVGIEVKLLQGPLEVENLLWHLLQATVGIIQHGDDLLLPAETPARHQAADDFPFGCHLQAAY